MSNSCGPTRLLLPMKFSRQEYWSGWPLLSPGDLPDPGIEPGSPALQVDSLPSELHSGNRQGRELGNSSSGLPWWLTGKESPANAEDMGSIPGSGRSSGEGNGNALQHSCLENPMDRGDWWAIVHGVAKSRT